jgi:hypothetical protein
MTILGKILVIVNLVFSLFMGFMIMSVYVTRTNWKAGFDKMKDSYTVAVADAEATRIERDAAKSNGDKAVAEMKIQVDNITRDRDGIKSEIEGYQNKVNDLQKSQKDAVAQVSVVTGELDRRKLEVNKLQELVVNRDKMLVEKEEKVKDLRDRAVAAEIAQKSEHDRNVTLLNQVATLSKDLEQARAGTRGGVAVAGGTTLKPPPEDVEGVVLEADAKAHLYTISLGSDAGLSPGNTLYVYRLKPKPEYVGTIKIVDAHHHESVGTALKAGPIQKGDIVASRIGGGK